MVLGWAGQLDIPGLVTSTTTGSTTGAGYRDMGDWGTPLHWTMINNNVMGVRCHHTSVVAVDVAVEAAVAVSGVQGVICSLLRADCCALCAICSPDKPGHGYDDRIGSSPAPHYLRNLPSRPAPACTGGKKGSSSLAEY